MYFSAFQYLVFTVKPFCLKDEKVYLCENELSEDQKVIFSLLPLIKTMQRNLQRAAQTESHLMIPISRLSMPYLSQIYLIPFFLSAYPLGFIMLTQTCSLWPISQTLLALSICLDLDWIKAPTDKMMATSAPVWKTLRVCPADPLALSHPQANHSQSQGCRGEVSEESQHLIGELQRVRFFIFFLISGGLGTAAHSSFLSSK